LGEYTEKILNQNNPQVFIFEPVQTFFDVMKRKFLDKTNVEVINYAIGLKSRKILIGLSGAASGINMSAEEMVEIEFKTPSDYPHVFRSEIDVCKINIEGGEYELIRALHTSDYLQNIKVLFIQFHELPTESVSETKKILELTHQFTWGYEFVWERWDRKLVT